MDSISFEKVSLQEAKAALEARDKVDKPKNAWAENRRLPSTEDMQLQSSTFKWIASLPRNVQPRQLALQFPRVANKLAQVWGQTSACERLLDELMVDNRGKRQGFPVQVASEIMALMVHFNSAPLDHPLDWSTSVEGRVR
jgi:hypothetical protein